MSFEIPFPIPLGRLPLISGLELASKDVSRLECFGREVVRIPNRERKKQAAFSVPPTFGLLANRPGGAEWPLSRRRLSAQGPPISLLNSRDLPTCHLAGVTETQL